MAKWVLVANGSQARIFEQEGKSTDLTLIKTFSHPESRQKDGDLAADRAGSFAAHGGMAHGSFNEASSPKENEMALFAKELVDYLEQGRVQNSFSGVTLVASPNFHGMLNKNISEPLKRCVLAHIDKDYTSLKDDEVGPQLKRQLS